MLATAENSWTIFEAAHLLNRAGFGGSPSEIKALHALGRTAAADSLISPTEPLNQFPLPAWSSDKAVISDFRARRENRQAVRKAEKELSPEAAEKLKREGNQQAQKEYRKQAMEAQAWWFRRMLKTRAPLREKMTLFWHDHFATSIQKVREPALLIRQNDLFRKNALGNFKELTQAILLDPAMLRYLDGQSSRKGKPNENFAREVMELFTLGEGNYTESDVREAARAFTGYHFNPMKVQVVHRKLEWDPEEKIIFGKTGKYNGSEVINLIFEKKESARFIVKKLWEFFVIEEPSGSTIDNLTETLRAANFVIAPLLREIFLSKEFYSTTIIRTQIKCPVQYLIALLKQLEITEPPLGFPIAGQLQLGQVLFTPPNVAGWDWGHGWINTNTLLTRYNLAGFLTKGSEESSKLIPDNQKKIPRMGQLPKKSGLGWRGPDYEKIAPRPMRENISELVDLLIFRFFQSPVPEKARDSFMEYATAKKGVIFTNKETAELCHLILSTPYYQLA